MKCENCSTELVGASIVCRQCNHNNAQGRVGQWRARRNGEQSAAARSSATRSISPLASPAIAPKPEIKRLPIEPVSSASQRRPSVPFESKARINQAAIPNSSPAQSSAASSDDPNVVQFPAWRSQLKDKVKEVRERRTTPASEADNQPDEAQLDPNPIVESALKRIRWSQHIQPTQIQPAQTPVEQAESKPATAQEQKSAMPQITEARRDTNPFQRVEPKPESQPLPRATHSSTNPLLARKPVAQPAIRPELVPQLAPKSDPAQPFLSEAEARVEVKPGSGSLPAVPKIRTTGEIKQPAPSPQRSHSGPLAQPQQRTPSGSLVQPPRNHVETKVIGLAPSVSNLAGYAPAGALSPAKPRRATLWGRTLAGACDFEIVAMAYLPVFGSYAVFNTSVGYESVVILLVLLATLIFCYQLLTLTIANRTTGMAFLRLRLVNSSNREKPVTFVQKLLRAFAATAASFCPPLNFLVIQSNPQHRSLPDLISGTSLLERLKSP
ncbi:MAG: RDD family protein [Acidobacteriota bacterium]